MNQVTMMNEFEQYCKEIVDKYDIPGFSIGLSKDGELFYDRGFGYRNTAQKLPLSADTVFGIGSVTKSFTCVAILQLQEAGKLNVHDPVIKYIPEYKTPDENHTKQTTIHHFMTHSAGLPPLATLHGALKNSLEKEPKFDEDSQSEEKKENPLDKLPVIDTYQDLLEFIGKENYKLLGAPGTEFSYSNDAYSLLGLIIERVSGKTYEQYVKDYILDPAGMHHSVFHIEELKNYDDVASLYNSRKKDDETIIFESNNPWDAPSMRAAGFLKSTVNDMMKYLEIFRNGGKVGNVQILSLESVELMTTPYIECAYEKYYGYGLMITPDFFGYKLVEHGGSVKGVAAQMAIIPEIGVTGVSFANLAGVPSTKLLFSAFANFLGKKNEDLNLNLKEIKLPSDALTEYEGTFVSGEGMTTKFSIEDNKLLLTAEGMVNTVLKPVGEDLFLIQFRESEITIRFVRDDNSKIHRVAFGFRQIPKVG
ncbi:serine hydrolase [Bacillus sp. CGMCC 1.16607]|uniref:serine hydrolase n=1 Tax=Bacillus sp. CGMCC 1.16607 TaxID=3351842 RepID=UPI0036430B8E